MKVRLTNVEGVWTHPSLADLGEEGVWVPGEDGALPVTETYRNGDVVDLDEADAEHLVNSGRAEAV